MRECKVPSEGGFQGGVKVETEQHAYASKIKYIPNAEGRVDSPAGSKGKRGSARLSTLKERYHP